MNELVKDSNIGRSTVYKILKELLEESLITKTGTKPKLYRVTDVNRTQQQG